ncbi:MAG: CemA family protein [Synechococcales cyanobacterium C42_A2020_086]|jgi:hypothetical protein|nr:CemA family protein [Synechococcales cyanobacterium C42_A2020_086]
MAHGSFDLSLNLLHHLSQINAWLHRQQLQRLKAAYEAAAAIKALEDYYYEGGKIAYGPEQTKTVFDYVKSLRDRQLFKIRFNLTLFRLGGFWLSPQMPIQSVQSPTAPGLTSESVEIGKPDADMIQKLQFIEAVICKYREPDEILGHWHGKSLATAAANASEEPMTDAPPPALTSPPKDKPPFFRGFGHLKQELKQMRQELSPEYEQQVIQEIRLRRKQDQIAIRCLALLLIVPILVQLVSKNLILEPILGNYSDRHPSQIELSEEIRQHFLAEFVEFKEGLEIEQLLGKKMTDAEKEARLQEAAVEFWRESREAALNGLKNVVADLIALLSFVIIAYANRAQLAMVRSVSNRAFLSLSDPAKVFLFILVTDMFVGFHSAEGWEVILEGVTHHFGLPESKVFINGFIATVPVVIDSCIKFWIFSYLTRYSPSASAIYERMNT